MNNNKYISKQKRIENARKRRQNTWLIFISKTWIAIYIAEITMCILCALVAKENKAWEFTKMFLCLSFLTFISTYYLKVQRPSKPIQNQEPPRIQCPYCKSYYTEKISTINRGASTVAFGLASSKIGKQWHCKNCNSDF